MFAFAGLILPVRLKFLGLGNEPLPLVLQAANVVFKMAHIVPLVGQLLRQLGPLFFQNLATPLVVFLLFLELTRAKAPRGRVGLFRMTAWACTRAC